MSRRRRTHHDPVSGQPGPGDQARPSLRGPLGTRPVSSGVFELVHPPCVEERWPDYEEALEIWKEGDRDEARDALRFILDGCGDNLWVHVALGRLALEGPLDLDLARGHFGYAVELVEKALPRDFSGSLPRSRHANRPYHEAADGLARCLEALGHHVPAREVRARSKRLAGDPT